MPSALGVSGEVASAAASLAGLILVFLGALAAGYGSFDRTAQKAVKVGFERRAWFAFAGFALCLVALACALAGKWLQHAPSANAAIIALGVALVVVVIAGLSTVREIK